MIGATNIAIWNKVSNTWLAIQGYTDPDPIVSLALTFDGNLLFVATVNKVRLWNGVSWTL